MMVPSFAVLASDPTQSWWEWSVGGEANKHRLWYRKPWVTLLNTVESHCLLISITFSRALANVMGEWFASGKSMKLR